MMDERSRNASENPDEWNRPIPLDEAQETAGKADPDDLGGTSPIDSGMTAGGEGTALGVDDSGAGGAPYTEGYVTGGSHHPTIADLPKDGNGN